MVHRLVLVLAVLAMAEGASMPAHAHGGGLDRNGCHNDRRNGGYHCHRGAPAPAPSYGLSSGVGPDAPSPDLVRAAQTLLNHLGCEAGGADGSAGAGTSAAIARFNAATGEASASTTVSAVLVRRLAEATERNQRCE